MFQNKSIGVVIPCYKVKKQILRVLEKMVPEVDVVYVVDDKCPENSGDFVKNNCDDARVKVLYNEVNKGVGGAVIHGYKQALADGIDVVVKLDGDDQMDAGLIVPLIKPIVEGKTDYRKGNRFYYPKSLSAMPMIRLIGNGALSFINKFVNGYWHIMDPTNGFTAIHKNALKLLELNKINERYFFESDMLFRLAIQRAVVQDFAMHAKYADEESNLSVTRVLFDFPPKYIVRFFKRLGYMYFLRDINLGSFHLTSGLLLLLFGLGFGGSKWYVNSLHHIATPTGTVMISVVCVILGIQLLLAFLNYDVSNRPQAPNQNE